MVYFRSIYVVEITKHDPVSVFIRVKVTSTKNNIVQRS